MRRKFSIVSILVTLSATASFAYFSFLISPSAYALDSSTSASLKSKIQALEQEIASKAAKLKAEVDKRLANHIASGTTQAVTANQILIQADSGTTQVVLINDFVTYSQNGQETKRQPKKDDYIIALGDLDDKGNLVAKKIIETKKSLPTPLQYLWGKIVSVSGSVITIQNKENNTLKVNVGDDTIFRLAGEEASLSAVEPRKFLIAVLEGSSSATTSGVVKARFIYLIPTGGFLRPLKNKVATPSGSFVK